MDWLSLVQLAMQFGPSIKAIIDEATSNDDIVTKVKAAAPSLATMLESFGAKLFPTAAPEIHIAAGAIAAFDPSVTKWLQASCNSILNPSPGLVVDGIYGPKTREAVAALQAKLGLPVDGFAGMVTQAAINALTAQKLPTKNGR